MIYLEEVNIAAFRGIKDLHIKNIGNINLIVGDNNSGKTSVLEAMMLLRNVKDFSNILKVIRLRENNYSITPFRMSAFEKFTYMFQPSDNQKFVSVDAKIKGDKVGININGTIENVMIDYNEIEFNNKIKDQEELYGDNETAEFQGKISSYTSENNIQTEELRFNQYMRLTGTKVSKPDSVEIIYVSPTQHVAGNVFSKIVKHNSYKQLVLKVIQLFDEDIEDMLYMKNEQTGRAIEHLKHKKLGIMPLVTYGDGIKKVLLLANSIAEAENGILLVDEIETAIHVKYYNEIFSFVVNACMKFNIQLFATTHSIESVDTFLDNQYNNEKNIHTSEEDDLIRVITFRKNIEKNKTYARVLTGKEVFENRSNFGFEVR